MVGDILVTIWAGYLTRPALGAGVIARRATEVDMVALNSHLCPGCGGHLEYEDGTNLYDCDDGKCDVYYVETQPFTLTMTMAR